MCLLYCLSPTFRINRRIKRPRLVRLLGLLSTGIGCRNWAISIVCMYDHRVAHSSYWPSGYVYQAFGNNNNNNNNTLSKPNGETPSHERAIRRLLLPLPDSVAPAFAFAFFFFCYWRRCVVLRPDGRISGRKKKGKEAREEKRRKVQMNLARLFFCITSSGTPRFMGRDFTLCATAHAGTSSFGRGSPSVAQKSH